VSLLLQRARPMMGTFVRVCVRGERASGLEAAVRCLFAEMERLESVFSEFRTDSAVSRVNRAAGKAKVRVPAELVEVLQIAERVSRASSGAFDVTWAPLARLWKLGLPGFRPPSARAVAAARRLVDFRDVQIDARERTVFLCRRGMSIGLGGIAKAHVAERAAALALEIGVRDVLIDAGGDIVARGRNGDRQWTVGIRHPRSPTRMIAALELRDEAVATSGDYERFVEVGGRRYHHLLDPRLGRPAHASQSATVRAPRGVLADALSTAVFVMGTPGLEVVSKFAGVMAFVVDANGLVSCSDGQLERRVLPR